MPGILDQLSQAAPQPEQQQAMGWPLSLFAGQTPRPEVGPFPNMGNPIRPNPLAPDYNLNMRPDMSQFAQQLPPGLAQLLLGMMSQQGQAIPPTGQGR